MKHLKSIFFLLIPLLSLSQSKLYKITYLTIADIDNQVLSTDVLYVDEKKAYYEIGKKEVVSKNNYNMDAIFIKQKEKIKSFVYTDILNHKLYNIIEKKNIYKTVEPIPVMNWILTNESKEVEGILLHKVTVHFRGRNYEAWCDLDLPISVGPWKFNGVPGLIYEIRSLEKDYSYSWILKEFKQIAEDKKLKETLLLLTARLNKDYTDLESNIKKMDEEELSGINISDIRLPEGIFVESAKVIKLDLKEIRKKRAEIEYEWEI
ncbi:GLPGLI family protein [Paenimyroides ceti]